MSSPVSESGEGPFRRFLSRLSFPKLFLVLSGLFLVDAFIPDAIPFIDEAILGTLAVLVSAWKRRRTESRPASTDHQIR